MTDIHETQLPGVGVRHDFETNAGRRIGVIVHHAGHRELLVYDQRDPDACRETVRLDEHDAHMLAEMLGAAQVKKSEEALQQSIEGLTIDWIRLRQGSAAVGRTIGEVELRRRTGVTIIAVVGERGTVPSPGAEHEFAAGDTLVVVGSAEQIPGAYDLLQAK